MRQESKGDEEGLLERIASCDDYDFEEI